MRAALAGILVVLALGAGLLLRSWGAARTERVGPHEGPPPLSPLALVREDPFVHERADPPGDAPLPTPGDRGPVGSLASLGGCRLTGVLCDDEGRALEGLELELRPFAGARPEATWGSELAALSEAAVLATATCGREGEFAFEHVPAGGWALFARGGADLPRAAYRFRIGAEQRAVHKVLTFARGLCVRARVLDPDGKPVPGAELRATGLDTDFQACARSAHDGRSLLGPLLAGTYRVEASGAESLTTASRTASAGDEELLELHLAPAGLLSVLVRDEAGAPVQVRLELHGPSERIESGTEFRLARLTPGSYECVATAADGRVAVLQELALEAGLVPVPHELVVRPGCALELRLGGGARRLWRATWRGTLVAQGWLEPGGAAHAVVPPGSTTVAWWSTSEDVGGIPEHEEQRILDVLDQPALFEHAAPK